jgi:hypothetical protein
MDTVITLHSMKLKDSVLDLAFRETDESLGALLVYENVAAGKKAKGTCDVVAEGLGIDCELRIELYSFEALGELTMRRAAAVAAANANLVIVSCVRAELPWNVREWIEFFLWCSGRPAALVALFASASDRTTGLGSVEKYLAGVAEQRRMQYFSHVYESPLESGADALMPERQGKPNDDSYRRIRFR